MRGLKIFVAWVVAIFVGGALIITRAYWWDSWEESRYQAQFDSFYAVPENIEGSPGDVLRVEEAPGWETDNTEAKRFIYVTETPDGTKRTSSALVWVPKKQAEGKQKVVAWAHPTVGLGVQCAPSRNSGSLKLTGGWISYMADQGWLVVGTDYTGLGTPPQPQSYLVGQQEARDVTYSVKALSKIKGLNPDKDWAVWGHSQGGHSALWTGALAKDLAPELNLVAATAAAPAADLYATFEQQWDKLIAWVIGPEAVISWPNFYPNLSTDMVNPGPSTVKSQAYDCLTPAGLFGLLHQEIEREKFFSSNPLNDASWAKTVGEETPKPITDIPVFIGQGTADEVVLANAAASLQIQWCKAGSNLTMEWLGGAKHEPAGQLTGPAVTDWLVDVFAGQTPKPNCSLDPPVKPFKPEIVVPPIPGN